MKFASFDLETHVKLPEDQFRDEVFEDTHIICAAVAFSDGEEDIVWYDSPFIEKQDSRIIVEGLQKCVNDGYTLVTWNGAGFDFKLLAYQSGMFKECGEIALHHIDLMLYVTFIKGWYLGLDTALEGAGIQHKLKKVYLKNGSLFLNMCGAEVPRLWAEGEYDVVLDYLFYDVTLPLKLVENIIETKKIQWQSKKGKSQRVAVPELLSVKNLFSIPEPDVSWMTGPPKREQFVNWIPEYKKLL